MPKRKINEFAKLLIKEVRDKAIENCDSYLDPDGNDAQSKRWHEELKTSSPLAFAKIVISDCVDDVIFQLLYAIDDGMLPLIFKAKDGTEVDLEKDGEGEMAGEYITTDGWRAKYSNQRFFDDFAD